MSETQLPCAVDYSKSRRCPVARNRVFIHATNWICYENLRDNLTSEICLKSPDLSDRLA